MFPTKTTQRDYKIISKTILYRAWHAVSTCFNIFTTNIWSGMDSNLRGIHFMRRVLHSSAVSSPFPTPNKKPWSFLSSRWCYGSLHRPSHLLALSVLQIKVRVEVDHNSLVWLRSLNQPLAFLAWMISVWIARRGEIPRLHDSYIFTTFICD